MVELFDPKFRRENYMKPVSTEDGQQLDYFDTKLTNLLKNLDRVSSFTYTYDGSERLENIAYRFYGSTSLWWVIMEFNGFIHPLQIRDGEVIRIPSKNDIDSIVSEDLPKNRRSRRKTI